jgi:hypothetical protein
MRKALGSAALAAMLSMGIGTATVAHATVTVAQTDVADDADEDESWIEENLGLFGLLGLLGLAGLGGRGRGGARTKGGSSGGYAPPRAPRGGHTTDWSSR